MFQLCADWTFPNGISPLENRTAFFFAAVVYHHCTVLMKFLWKTKEKKTGTTTRDQLRELLTESFR
jgi:hypothetical protein